MHEVGHSLGLRHNFKASTMLNADQLNDTSITRVKGLVGSVMDYSPINIAPKGKKQGDYYSTTIGPYDYWAIEYAYKPVDGNEDERAEEDRRPGPRGRPGLRDRRGRLVQRRPAGQPLGPRLRPLPVRQGPDRAGRPKLLKDLDAKVVKDGESWARTRRAFSILLGQWGDGAVARLAVRRRPVGLPRPQGRQGGQRPDRPGLRGQAARVPEVPGRRRSSATRRSSSRRPCSAGSGTEKWMHWGSDGLYGAGVDISVLETDPGDPEDRPGRVPRARRPSPGSRTSSSRPSPAPTRSGWRRSSGR